MVTFRSSIDIGCSAEDVFAVYRDVVRWPEWTASVTEVERLEAGPLRLGSRARVRQPRLPVAEWVVTDLQPGRAFSWEARGPGLRTTGRHLVEPTPDGCRVVAELEQAGPLGPLVAWLTRNLTQRYLRMELEGLRARCERRPG